MRAEGSLAVITEDEATWRGIDRVPILHAAPSAAGNLLRAITGDFAKPDRATWGTLQSVIA